MSHPSWVCGLKLGDFLWLIGVKFVTPFVGVWIETKIWKMTNYLLMVTPFVGVWIETLLQRIDNMRAESHPSWVCGLKR